MILSFKLTGPLKITAADAAVFYTDIRPLSEHRIGVLEEQIIPSGRAGLLKLGENVSRLRLALHDFIC